MGTSKSASASPTRWSARAHAFSGRPDPTWTVESSVGEQLEGLWNKLPATHLTLPVAPPLGYRGCVLLAEGRTWQVYRGVVERVEGARVERRSDATRNFERTILASAPEGLIPPAVIAEVS
ncbi:MAG: hypothetical protein HYR72_26955 [Deltaproteobacteria bacterium]|nr:hypothetical protein [Deltaproteobacteria bacterium]MBI3390346.1 hypothetical protein [Deltaproteobacteria bacterium]